MTKPFGAITGLWRGVLLVGAVVCSAAACGDDAPREPNGAIPDAGNLGGAGDGGSAGSAGSAGNGGAGGASGAAANVCEPGATRLCEVDRICSGVETCTADGLGFGECECSAVGLVGSGLVGARCEDESDCALGGVCARADSDFWRGQGGPAGGYCTFSCVDDADCTAKDIQSECVALGPGGTSFCIRTCLSKEPESGEAKCLNRPDVVCQSFAAQGVEGFSSERQGGYCAAQCGSDLDCPPGRFCHRVGGICTTVPAEGAPIGSRCDTSGDCDSRRCEDLDAESVGTCTALCVLGSLSGCGYDREATRREAACLTPYVAAGQFTEGTGDVGLCRELCDVAEDCQRAGEGWLCGPLSAAGAAFFGRSGACRPP